MEWDTGVFLVAVIIVSLVLILRPRMYRDGPLTLKQEIEWVARMYHTVPLLKMLQTWRSYNTQELFAAAHTRKFGDARTKLEIETIAELHTRFEEEGDAFDVDKDCAWLQEYVHEKLYSTKEVQQEIDDAIKYKNETGDERFVRKLLKALDTEVVGRAILRKIQESRRDNADT